MIFLAPEETETNVRKTNAMYTSIPVKGNLEKKYDYPSCCRL
jgi:hypothetical protein